MFGISAGEFIVLVAVAAVVLGPERLPEYARMLARLIREMRQMAQGAGAKVRDEMGPEFDEIDWRKLDPRQYDPRRIVREALSDAFDPDDPLGIKEAARAEKPVSRGGPAEATAAARRAAPAPAPAPDQPGPALPEPATGTDGTSANGAHPDIAFDPDAT